MTFYTGLGDTSGLSLNGYNTGPCVLFQMNDSTGPSADFPGELF